MEKGMWHEPSTEIRRITLDGERMTDRGFLRAYLREQMELPDYCGENLDALYDVLTDIGAETELCLINVCSLSEGDRFCRQVLRVFREAAEDNCRLTLTEST